MSFRKDSDDERKMDAVLEQTLKDFRSSVRAWSEAVYDRPHKPVKVYLTSWRVVAGWALGCVLTVGTLSGGLYVRHEMKEQAKIAAAAEEAARQQKLDAQKGIESEDLFAKVDRDVSREVPSAMEPLAQMMAEDSEQ